jgi:hypothetical protein
MLSDTDRAILAIEAEWWGHAGAKEQRVRSVLDMSMTRYHQRLSALLDCPDAYAEQPVLLNRLRRLRDARRTERPRVFM